MKDNQIRKWKYGVSLLTVGIILLMLVGIGRPVSAASTISVGKSFSTSKDKKYTLKISHKTKVKFTVKVAKDNSVSDEDEDAYYEKKGVEVSLYEKGDYYDQLSYWNIYEGKSASKTVVLEKGTYYLETDADNISYTVSLKDVSTYAKKIKISKTTTTILTGESKKLSTSVVSPKHGYVKDITWKTSNKKIATVDSKGNVFAKKAGTCTISAKLTGGNTVKCKVTVKKAPSLYVKGASFDINYLGGVEPVIQVKNNYSKTIKYIDFHVRFYNTVGDPAYCSISGTYKHTLRVVGPLKSGVTNTYYWDAIIYNYNTGKMYIKDATVIFTDGSRKTVSIKKSYK